MIASSPGANFASRVAVGCVLGFCLLATALLVYEFGRTLRAEPLVGLLAPWLMLLVAAGQMKKLCVRELALDADGVRIDPGGDETRVHRTDIVWSEVTESTTLPLIVVSFARDGELRRVVSHVPKSDRADARAWSDRASLGASLRNHLPLTLGERRPVRRTILFTAALAIIGLGALAGAIAIAVEHASIAAAVLAAGIAVLSAGLALVAARFRVPKVSASHLEAGGGSIPHAEAHVVPLGFGWALVRGLGRFPWITRLPSEALVRQLSDLLHTGAGIGPTGTNE